jgi:hypothetical protein
VKRDPRLVRLSWDHHHGLVMAHRIAKELPVADDEGMAGLYSELLAFWAAGLLPHFRVEQECLLARLLRHRPADDAAVRTTLDEHLELEALVATMRDTTEEGVRRESLLRFGARLAEHIRWEEADLFQRTQEDLSEDELDALAVDFEQQLPPLAPAPWPAGTR